MKWNSENRKEFFAYIEKLIDDVECDILRPAGIEGQKKVAIKEYVDVNSAIALACEALRI